MDAAPRPVQAAVPSAEAISNQPLSSLPSFSATLTW
jgi:hypothetical protein